MTVLALGSAARANAQLRMAPIKPNPKSILAFESEQAFEAWLERNHDKALEVYLRIYKKDSRVPSVTHAQALDVALCWGWIDGIRKGYDEKSFLQRFTPRKAKSIWSQINRDNVARLVAAGRMTSHGEKHVQAAKADGRWDAAYAPARSMQIPPDLKAAIEANPRASKTFATLSKQNLFALAFRTGNMRTAAGRAKKIADFVAMLARGETLHPSPRPKAPARLSNSKRTRARE